MTLLASSVDARSNISHQAKKRLARSMITKFMMISQQEFSINFTNALGMKIRSVIISLF